MMERQHMTLIAMQRREPGSRAARHTWRRGGITPRIGYYQFYLMDAAGKVHSAASMHCHDDLDAVEKAPFELQQSAGYPVIEIWHGRRLVERIGACLAA